MVGLIFSLLLILVSVFYDNPKTMVECKPGIIDWFEGLVHIGLLVITAAFLLLEGWGLTLFVGSRGPQSAPARAVTTTLPSAWPAPT